MSRVAKGDVHASLARVAQQIIDAGGPDGRISRADMEAKLETMDGTERALANMFFRFIDHRDHVPGATVTAKDVNRAVEYAKEKLIDKYDLNNNGLSKSEIQEMSRTGKLAVQLAKELRAVNADTPIGFDQDWPEKSVQGTYFAYWDYDDLGDWSYLDYNNWQPDLNVDKGSLSRIDGEFSADGMDPNLTEDQVAMLKQVTVDLWDNTFQYRYANGGSGDNGTVILGQAGNAGHFELGTFTNEKDGQEYQIVRWADIDDNSFTMFFQKNDAGDMVLKASQYDN
ncbi:MAG: hypothetical protein EP343_02960 [Deltaproteobacteria bacterium]|nr:MAG: hypothetical protein EP343_02960 [Deltaproteobacteria bacterium]